MAVAAYTSRPRTAEVAGALRLVLCDQGDGDCNRLCTARRSDLPSCDGAAGFDDREMFELVLEPGHRSPLYRASHLAARFALGLAAGQEWSHFYYLNGGAEIARVEVPDWLAQDPELLAVSHAMLVKQCQLGLGYPVVISEAHEQAVITGHDREEFRRMTLMLLEQRGLPTPRVRQVLLQAPALGVTQHRGTIGLFVTLCALLGQTVSLVRLGRMESRSMFNGSSPGPAPAPQTRASTSRITRSRCRTCPHRKLCRFPRNSNPAVPPRRTGASSGGAGVQPTSAAWRTMGIRTVTASVMFRAVMAFSN